MILYTLTTKVADPSIKNLINGHYDIMHVMFNFTADEHSIVALWHRDGIWEPLFAVDLNEQPTFVPLHVYSHKGIALYSRVCDVVACCLLCMYYVYTVLVSISDTCCTSAYCNTNIALCDQTFIRSPITRAVLCRATNVAVGEKGKK